MRWLLTLVLLVAGLAGCGLGYECMGGDRERCRAAAEAAADDIPPGYETLSIGQGVGFQSNPLPILACYPDGSAVALEALFEGGDVTIRPYRGDGLAELCDL